MRKSNNNTLISRSRQVQNFQWKSSQPTKNSVQKCLCVAIRGNFKFVIVAAILVFLLSNNRYLYELRYRSLCWRADLSEVSSLEISSVIVRTTPLPFYHLSALSYTPFHAFSYPKGHDRNFRNKEEKEIQFDTFSFSHTLLYFSFYFLFSLVIFYISIFHDKTRSDECNTLSRERGPT